MNNGFPVNTLIVGKLAQETIINNRRKLSLDRCGGNLLYTAYGFNLWRQGAGLSSKVGMNFPENWLAQIAVNAFDVSGIKRLPHEIDLREFYAFTNEDDYRTDNPQKYFGDLGLPFPKSLLGYSPKAEQLDNRKTASALSMRPNDLPVEFLECRFSYFCPMDFFTHSLLPPVLRSTANSTVFINPGTGYMHPSFWYDLPALLRGSTAVITTRNRLEKLFLGRSKDIWEMAQTIASFGVEFVAVTAGADGQFLYVSAAQKKYHIPAYPTRIIDTIGASDVFGGAFLAGYSQSFDPLWSALMGNIAASIKVEGTSADYLLYALPELAKARLENLRGKVEEC